MTGILAKWASNNGQIIKSGLSDGRREKFLPLVVGGICDWRRIGVHLGNVGLNNCPISWDHLSVRDENTLN